MALSTRDQQLLRKAIRVSERSVENGNQPFGGLLADPAGEVLLEAENSTVTGRDPTAHAETNLVKLAVRQLLPDEIATSTLYTSCEPCAMCAGTMYWGGINRMVYAMSEADLLGITGANSANPTMTGVGCRTILSSGQRDIEVLGPYLIEEAMEIHRTYWLQ
ncbi:MAG: nucleoside deaminase [Acidimicrobiia bacterium]|nr:MAG: nucleoside deaminase [Acidimicrobiia bacterium]